MFWIKGRPTATTKENKNKNKNSKNKCRKRKLLTKQQKIGEMNSERKQTTGALDLYLHDK